MGAAGLRPVQGLQNSFSLWEVPGWSQGVGKSLIILTVAPLPPPRPQQTPRAQETPLRRQPPLGWRGSPPHPRPARGQILEAQAKAVGKHRWRGVSAPLWEVGGHRREPTDCGRTSCPLFPCSRVEPVALGVVPHTLPGRAGGVTASGQPAGGRRLRFHPSPAPRSSCGFRQISCTGACPQKGAGAPPPPTRTKDTEGRASGTEGNAGVRPFWD